MTRIPFAVLEQTLTAAMQQLGLAPERAALAARLTAEADRDGIRTHGIARFPRFAEMVRRGHVIPDARPGLVASFGALERWTGNRGPGNLAAYAAMGRAMELAAAHGIGAVALAQTNHWQRGGSFGWQAADAGCAAICWTNTLANIPPWGAKTPAVGNNPLVIAVPAAEGQTGPIVLDMALSQYSYGTLTDHRQRHAPLPFPGGFDEQGCLTTDAAAIERTQRALPVGLWKGSGLAFALDVLGALLADGLATHEIPVDPLAETGQSQVFVAFGPQTVSAARPVLQNAVEALHAAEPSAPGELPRFPGERVLSDRAENLETGVPVSGEAWALAQRLAAGEAA